MEDIGSKSPDNKPSWLVSEDDINEAFAIILSWFKTLGEKPTLKESLDIAKLHVKGAEHRVAVWRAVHSMIKNRIKAKKAGSK